MYSLDLLAEWPTDVLTLALETWILRVFKMKAIVPSCPVASYPSANLSHPWFPPGSQGWYWGWIGFATFGGLTGEVSSTSAPEHAHHTSAIAWGSPHHSGFLSCSGLHTQCLRDPFVCSLMPTLLVSALCILCCLVRGQWHGLKHQFSNSFSWPNIRKS